MAHDGGVAEPTSDEINWGAEHACAAAWPAGDEQRVGGWIVRRSGGGTRRANSASPAHADATLDAGTLTAIEALFAAHRQPAILRVPSLTPAIDAALTEAGYGPPDGMTHTLAATLSGEHRRDAAVTLSDSADAAWRAARMRLSRALGGRARDHVDVLDRLRVPALFARIEADGDVQAVGYVALVGGLAVVESIATDPAHRRRGFARRCTESLLAAAHYTGARDAVLQVVADNAAALALYAQLGFTAHLYDYHYRRRMP